jgi:predicted nuclease of predicted toxin-antitoxin system
LIRLLLDQGCPRSAALILNRSGWDVVHVGEINMGRATDVEILEIARQQQRICVTLDADFHTHLAVTNAAMPSVIRLRIEGLKAEAFAQLLIDLWPQIQNHVESGAAMITVNHQNVRIRSLPIVP